MKITDADRQVAAEHLPFADEECGECECGLMRAGEMDDHWLVQSFARHREASGQVNLKALWAYESGFEDGKREGFLAGVKAALELAANIALDCDYPWDDFTNEQSWAADDMSTKIATSIRAIDPATVGRPDAP